MVVERESDAAIEARLRGFLAAELRLAESDYPHINMRKSGARSGAGLLGFATLGICFLAAVVLLRPWGSMLPAAPGADPLGSDGLPLSIGGQPVLRGADIETRIGLGNDGSSFLAGGYLILHLTACPAVPPTPSAGCPEDWRLEDAADGKATHSVRLTVSDGATIVRTSGAPTVFQVTPIVDAVRGGTSGQTRQDSLLIEAVAWRQPTKGPFPDTATPVEGGQINEALVPDFVSVWGGPSGETIVGYSPKELLLHPRSAAGGSLQDPPAELPVPVFGEDLVTLVGNMVPGHGFIPLGASPMPAVPGGGAGPSTGP